MSKYREGTIFTDMPRAKFNIVFVDRCATGQQPVVYVEDLCNTYGTMSITNDAERVVKWLNNRHPGYRIMYKDTDGNWDELLHDGGQFIGFQPGHAPAGYEDGVAAVWEGE